MVFHYSGFRAFQILSQVSEVTKIWGLLLKYSITPISSHWYYNTRYLKLLLDLKTFFNDN